MFSAGQQYRTKGRLYKDIEMTLTSEQLAELNHVDFAAECITHKMRDTFRTVSLMGHYIVCGEVSYIHEYGQAWIGVKRHGAESWELFSYHAVYSVSASTDRQIADELGWKPQILHIVSHDGQLVRSGECLLCELDKKMSDEFGENWPDHYWVLNTLPSWVVVPNRPEPPEYDPFNEE